jgi:V8-like Glu-specific endopeptidase
VHRKTGPGPTGIWIAAALTGCAAADAAVDDGPELQEQSQAIIYGTDDRQDLYEVDDLKLREIGRSSVAALIDKELVIRQAGGMVRVAPTTLKQMYGLCDGEPFENQPAAASCSGVLIDRDLLITAGHCVEDAKDCRSYAFVFDYAYRAEGELEALSASDVYGCRRLVARTFTDAGTDYAIVQLDRVPSGRSPVEIHRGPMPIGGRAEALGFTSGLPLKFDRGATVRESRAAQLDFFALDADTFEGSSGSAILDENYALAGVLVRGGEDYIETADGCSVSKQVPADSGTPDWGWEQATYVAPAIEALCEENYPSERLCGIAPSCGDGVCSFDPVDERCTEDCGTYCSNAACIKGALGSAEPGDPVAKEEDSQASSADECALRPGPSRSSPRWFWLLAAGLSFGLIGRRTRRRSAP